MSEHPNCEVMREQVVMLRAEMAAAEKEHESFRRRLNEHDEALKSLTDLTIAVKSMGQAVSNQADAIKGLSGSMDKMDDRLGKLETAPADNWKKMAFEVVKYVVLFVLGAVCAAVAKIM